MVLVEHRLVLRRERVDVGRQTTAALRREPPRRVRRPRTPRTTPPRYGPQERPAPVDLALVLVGADVAAPEHASLPTQESGTRPAVWGSWQTTMSPGRTSVSSPTMFSCMTCFVERADPRAERRAVPGIAVQRVVEPFGDAEESPACPRSPANAHASRRRGLARATGEASRPLPPPSAVELMFHHTRPAMRARVCSAICSKAASCSRVVATWRNRSAETGAIGTSWS